MQLDFGGYAKGYALDRAADILRENRIKHALVNLGGNTVLQSDCFTVTVK